METKDYTLTCGEVIDNLLTLACAYEKASAGKAPNGFAFSPAFSPAEAAANMKAAVHFIGSFGQQMPRWISVDERLPEQHKHVIGWQREWANSVEVWIGSSGKWLCGDFEPAGSVSHWMPLPGPPVTKENDDA